MKSQDLDCEFQIFASISRPEGSTHSCHNNEYVSLLQLRQSDIDARSEPADNLPLNVEAVET